MNAQARVPALDHDAMMLKQFDSKVSAEGKLERRIIANLIAHLDRAGFKPTSVWDGDELHSCSDAKSAMEHIFAVDECSLRFAKDGKAGERDPDETNLFADNEHGVLIICGNGVDIISDWNYSADDADAFNAAMDSFNAEDFA